MLSVGVAAGDERSPGVLGLGGEPRRDEQLGPKGLVVGPQSGDRCVQLVIALCVKRRDDLGGGDCPTEDELDTLIDRELVADRVGLESRDSPLLLGKPLLALRLSVGPQLQRIEVGGGAEGLDDRIDR